MLLVRAGILDRLKETRGISSDDAMARIGGVSVATYRAYRDGVRSPSGNFLANIGTAFGLSLGELATLVPNSEGKAIA